LITMKAAAGLSLVELGMVLAPGPNMIYLVSRSLSQGRRAGLVSLLGTLTGFSIYMTLANLGLSSVFLTVPWIYGTVRFAGAAYLLYLAWHTLRPGGTAVFEAQDMPRDSGPRLYRMGLLTNLLNPKAAILYLALIPQFIVPARGGVLVQGFVLGGLQIFESALVNAALILAAAGIAGLLARHRSWLLWQRRVMGLLLAAVGLTLALGA
jgi:threonine/homoserine/homoserine lactone efflux protein